MRVATMLRSGVHAGMFLLACGVFAGCYGSGSSVTVGVVGGYGYPSYGGYGYGGWGGWGGSPYGGVVVTGRPYVPRTHTPIDEEIDR
ncbi:MAG: hypothetical protein OEU54_00965 [Gemmatimonadota bacterium]|nr:hypothetical protein [Gemmatimonadota bacterium]